MVQIPPEHIQSLTGKIMNNQNKYFLQKAIKVLKDLHFKEENIMVTGSIALDLQGMAPAGRVAHDVDLIIKMDEQTWRCMKLIEAINNTNNKNEIFMDTPSGLKVPKDEYSESRKNTIFLDVDGLVLNIWRYDGKEWSDIKEASTGVYVATAEHIINAKKMYARPKDYQDINSICVKLLK